MSVIAGFGYLTKFTLTILSEFATLAWWVTKACCSLAWSAIWWLPRQCFWGACWMCRVVLAVPSALVQGSHPADALAVLARSPAALSLSRSIAAKMCSSQMLNPSGDLLSSLALGLGTWSLAMVVLAALAGSSHRMHLMSLFSLLSAAISGTIVVLRTPLFWEYFHVGGSQLLLESIHATFALSLIFDVVRVVAWMFIMAGSSPANKIVMTLLYFLKIASTAIVVNSDIPIGPNTPGDGLPQAAVVHMALLESFYESIVLLGIFKLPGVGLTQFIRHGVALVFVAYWLYNGRGAEMRIVCLSFVGRTLLFGCSGVVSRWGSARRRCNQGNALYHAGSGARLPTVAAAVVLAAAVRHAWVDSDGDGVMELSDLKQQADTDGDGTVCSRWRALCVLFVLSAVVQ